MAVMAEKKPQKDRHKHRQVQLRLHPIIRYQLDKLVDRNVSNVSSEITAAIRKHLEQHELWPPSDEDRRAAMEEAEGDSGE